jgi:kynurenine formamidase
MTFIDLSHPIEDGMAAYPGLPPVRIFAILDHDASRERYEGKAEFLLGGAELAGNTGTYLDAPFHRFREREDLARLPLETVAGLPGLVVDPADPGERYRSRASTNDPCADARSWCARGGMGDGGRRSTGRRRRSFPRRSSERLVAAEVQLVGVDFGNVDDTADSSRPPTPACSRPASRSWRTSEALEQLPREGSCSRRRRSRSFAARLSPVRAFAQVE